VNTIEFKRRELGERFDLRSSQKHVFQLPGVSEARVLEFDDVHFHEEGAILLPDPDPEGGTGSGDRVTGLSLLAACYRHAEKNTDQRLLVAGHAVADEPEPLDLSQGRATQIHTALNGDRDTWRHKADTAHRVQDYQHILKWMHHSRGWDCDPGPIDDILGSKTKGGIWGFQETYNTAFDNSIAVDGIMGPQTWGAIFDVYMEGVRHHLETDPSGLEAYRDLIQFVEPSCPSVGCGAYHPIPSDWASDYQSQADRRVEAFFYAPGEEPRVLEPFQDPNTPPQVDLFDPLWYQFLFIPRSPSKTVVEARVEITKIEGLYKPGHSNKDDTGHDKLSGYKEGYTSSDDRGRIFINHIPFSQASNDWQKAWKKDTQYIELTVELKDVSPDALPADTQVIWEWEDPDDPSNSGVRLDTTGKIEDRSSIPVREDAGQYLDPSDYSFEKKKGNWKPVERQTAEDNRGTCDYPSPGSGDQPTYEQIDPYKLVEVDDRACETRVQNKKSKVRLHCTNVGGDNLKVRVRLKPHPSIQDKGDDETGRMTMWKRIDIEYRRMKGAEKLPVDEVPPYFEPAFVQMDFTNEQEARPKKEYLAIQKADYDDAKEKYVKAPNAGVFEHEYDPGWFLLVSAHQAYKKIGSATVGADASEMVYDSRIQAAVGDGQVEITWPDTDGDLRGVNIYRSRSTFSDVADATRLNVTPVSGTSFTDGGLTNGTAYYYRITEVDLGGDEGDPSHLMEVTPQSSPTGPPQKPYFRTFGTPGDRRWEGIVIPKDITEELDYIFLIEGNKTVYIPVLKKISDEPSRGETTLFLHPLDHQPDFEPGTGLFGGPGEGGAYNRRTYFYPRYKLIRPANHWVSGGLGFSDSVDAAVFTAGSRSSSGTSPSNSYRGRSYFAGRTIVFSKHPTYQSKAGEEQTRDFLGTIVHEFAHAFGFPHKCGYYTFESPPKKGCSMNYGNTWVYAVETGRKYEVQPTDDSLEQIAIDHGLDNWRSIYNHPRNDEFRNLRPDPNDLYVGDTFWLPDSRSVQRFNIDPAGDVIEEGIHLCAQHIDGIRRVHLERNPALWHP